MGRTSKKYIHNAKSLRKYKKKELRDFIKENKLSIKRTSKLTKTEIVANLLRLQRNCGRTNKCMAQLPIKDKKKLSPLQQQALLKGQNAMRERRRLMKQEVTKEQKIDKKPIKIPQTLKVPVTREIIEEIKDVIRLEEKPTQLEEIKFEGGNEETALYQEILNLEDLIERAEKDIQKDKEYFEKIMKELEEEYNKKKEEPIEEEPIEEPSKDEEQFIREDIKILSVKELKQICKDNKIKGYSRLNKQNLIDIVYNNRDNIDNLQDLIDKKRESKL